MQADCPQEFIYTGCRQVILWKQKEQFLGNNLSK